MNSARLTSGAYRSPLREAQAAATRERILDAAGSLVERGQELTYAAIAEAAQVQERTVYRHFATKADLHAAFWKRTNADPLPLAEGARDLASLAALVERSFAAFDAREHLVRAMLHSEEGRAMRLGANAERRRRFERVVAAEIPKLDARSRRRAAAAAQVLSSAMAWEYFRDYWDMDGAEASACACQAIVALIDGLRRPGPQRPTRTRKKPT